MIRRPGQPKKSDGYICLNFAGINFPEPTFLEVKKEFIFANLAKIREIRELFFPRKFLLLR